MTKDCSRCWVPLTVPCRALRHKSKACRWGNEATQLLDVHRQETATKRCLKGLFPNINFDEKFRYKSRPSSITSHNVHCFMLLHCLLLTKSYHQLLVAPHHPAHRPVAAKKCHFDTFEIIFHPSYSITPWIHTRRRRRRWSRNGRKTFSIMVDIIL